jgi:hypothetical protein
MVVTTANPVPPSRFVPVRGGVQHVEELGAGVTELAIRDRVSMLWPGYACGTCAYCVAGWESLCEFQQTMGIRYTARSASARGLSPPRWSRPLSGATSSDIARSVRVDRQWARDYGPRARQETRTRA